MSFPFGLIGVQVPVVQSAWDPQIWNAVQAAGVMQVEPVKPETYV